MISRYLFLSHPWLALSLASDARPCMKTSILLQQPWQILILSSNSKSPLWRWSNDMRRSSESWRLTMISWTLVLDVPRATSIPLTHCLSAPKGTHSQHSRWSKALPQAPACRVDYSLTPFHWPHHRSWHTPGLETTQPREIRWDHRSRWTSGCFPDPGKSIHQWQCNPASCLPNLHKRGDIDLVRWTSSKVHRQLRHSC